VAGRWRGAVRSSVLQCARASLPPCGRRGARPCPVPRSARPPCADATPCHAAGAGTSVRRSRVGAGRLVDQGTWSVQPSAYVRRRGHAGWSATGGPVVEFFLSFLRATMDRDACWSGPLTSLPDCGGCLSPEFKRQAALPIVAGQVPANRQRDDPRDSAELPEGSCVTSYRRKKTALLCAGSQSNSTSGL
jgi:hypothetical protein